MRIIGGEFGSRKLLAPEGWDTRPTLDRVREAVFSTLTGRLFEAQVLDLFGGSGAYSLESISRGAQEATINDFSPKAVDVIKKNISSLHLQDRTQVLSLPFDKALAYLGQRGKKFSVVFLDPPYQKGILPLVLEGLDKENLLEQKAILVCETQLEEEIPLPESYSLWKSKRYGTVKISYVIWEGKE